MKILHASAEYFPYIKMGGLADMLASLTKEQAVTDQVYVALPYLSKMGGEISFTGERFSCLPDSEQKKDSITHEVLRDSSFRLANHGRVKICFFDSPCFRNRLSIYGEDEEHYRFAIFSYACYVLSQSLNVDVLHCHDWHTAIATALQKSSTRAIASVFTIHNLAYQGDHPFWMTGFLQEDPFRLIPTSFEQNGRCNYMKAGILSANQLTTVSPGYKNETLIDQNGFGLSPLLRFRANDYKGILNGIDTDEWNPQFDAKIHSNFSIETWKVGKRKNKEYLYQKIGRPHLDLEKPLIGLIGRLTHQKGYSQFLETYVQRKYLPFNYVVLGAGDKDLEDGFFYHSDRDLDSFYFYKGYNEELAHQIEAASDFFLMPSLFEPCGLNQMYSQTYGTIPIVSRVGGLNDTVSESLDLKLKTGIVFEPGDSASLGYALERAKDIYYGPERDTIVQNCMNLNWSWKLRKKEYAEVYQTAIDELF